MEKGTLTRTERVSKVPNGGHAPKEYKFWHLATVKIQAYIHTCCPETIVCSDGQMTYPLPGHLNVRGYDIWIPYNQKGMWFKSIEEFNELFSILEKEYNRKGGECKYKLFRWNAHYGQWMEDGKYSTAVPKFIGNKKQVEMIHRDIKNHLDNIDYLRELGESKSINYLMHGPPGTGKSTLIREIAGVYGYPIYIINGGTAKVANIHAVLSPVVLSEIGIVIFEDFDRYLSPTAETNQQTSVMSEILNTLDGINDHSNIIRFFT